MNSEQWATPWVELELITLSASEKVIGHGNTVKHAHMYYPGSCSDKPVQLYASGNQNWVRASGWVRELGVRTQHTALRLATDA